MSTVPFIFANNTGNIPLSQLDANFANVKLSVDYVIQNVQANITSVGTLTGLNVNGNVLVGGSANINGNVSSNVLIANIVTAPVLNSATVSLTGNLIVAGNATVNGTLTTINAETLNISEKEIVVANNVSTSALIDGAGIFAGSPTVSSIQYSDAAQGWGTANSFVVGQNLTVAGSSSVGGNITGGNIFTAGTLAVTGNVRLSLGTFRLPPFTTVQLSSITAQPGDMVYNTTVNKTQVWQHNAVGVFEWVSLGIAYYE
jgi:hypothetical protein